MTYLNRLESAVQRHAERFTPSEVEAFAGFMAEVREADKSYRDELCEWLSFAAAAATRSAAEVVAQPKAA